MTRPSSEGMAPSTMSLRPVDPQTLVPRIAEVQQAARAGQQGQEKSAAGAAHKNQETSRKGNEEVVEAQAPEQHQVTWRKERGQERRSLRREGKKGRSGKNQETSDEAEAREDALSVGPPKGDEPGQRLDLRG